jgi:hypothetical protein
MRASKVVAIITAKKLEQARAKKLEQARAIRDLLVPFL